jgi:pimeloyl-ACP methyl ester carboxylesterase
MIKRKQISLNGRNVRGECWGNEVTGRVVIFSHGFGVKRDSRGMFADLAKLLKDDCLVVLFDYVDVNEDGSTTAYSFSEQAEKLKEVIKYVREQFNPKEINIVAHSQGCIIAGLASPSDIDKVVLVAGPISAPGQRMKEYFSQREGTMINEKWLSKIKRSDGTITLVPSRYWQEANKVNPAELYLKLSKKAKVYFIRARQDQMIVREDYLLLRKSGGIEYIELQGNHDFEGKDRKPWLERMVSILQ